MELCTNDSTDAQKSDPAHSDLPRVQAASSQRPDVSPKHASAGSACRRILVVDDNIDAARSLAKLLTLLHSQDVAIAHDGPSALEIAESFQPQMVLLDIGLPGMNGHQVAKLLRGKTWFEGCMLVAVTGWGQEKDRAISQASGFDHHLVKPVTHATLRDLLNGEL